jgi:hypothetical protein
MHRTLLPSLFLLFLLPAGAETIDYEISRISSDNVSIVLAKGKKEYSVSDIVVEEKNSDGEIHWSKTLPLENGFGVGASIYREPKLTGFGLWGVNDGCRSFSWEWFNIEKLGTFKKLQEGGMVLVTYQGQPLVEEIAEIFFTTDISLRINNSCEVGKVTHRLLIKKGSVLTFAP